MQFAPAGSTPITLIFGFKSFARVETPVQSASSDRDQDIIYGRQLLNDLHGNASLTGCHIQVIERMHKGVAVPAASSYAWSQALVEYISVQYNLRSIASGAVHLHERESWSASRW